MTYQDAIDDHYSTLQLKESDIKEKGTNTMKKTKTNYRKGEYEKDEGEKWAFAGYFIGIIYYILYAISLLFFIYDKMYINIYNCLFFIFLLFLPYLLYMYIIPIFIVIIDFVRRKIIPKNVYIDLD